MSGSPAASARGSVGGAVVEQDDVLGAQLPIVPEKFRQIDRAVADQANDDKVFDRGGEMTMCMQQLDLEGKDQIQDFSVCAGAQIARSLRRAYAANWVAVPCGLGLFSTGADFIGCASSGCIPLLNGEMRDHIASDLACFSDWPDALLPSSAQLTPRNYHHHHS